MSIFDDAPAGATGVEGTPAETSTAVVPGAESASPVSPNEPGATGQPVSDPSSNVPEGQGAGVAEATGVAAPAVAPPALTEEQLTQIESGLPQNAGQAFAQFRTQNRDLSQQVEQLTQQVSEFQSQPGGIVIDAPVDEWNPISQLEKMPDPYYHKLANTLTDFHLPDRLEGVLNNYENLPQPAQEKIATAFMNRFTEDVGLTREQLAEAIEQYRNGAGGGQGGQAQQPAQGSASQSSYVQQLLDLGYDASEPIVLEAQQRERELGLLRGEVKQLRGNFEQIQSRNQASHQERQAQEQQARETEFQTKTTAVQGSVLGPIQKAIPQGYENAYSYIEAQALREIEKDPLAKTHLDNAKGALQRAAKFRAQGTPEFADREMQRHSGEMAKYAALFAIKAQLASKFVLTDLIAENVSLKNRFGNGQTGRREVVGAGAGSAIGANGRPVRGDGESADQFAARNRSYLISRFEQTQQGPGPNG